MTPRRGALFASAIALFACGERVDPVPGAPSAALRGGLFTAPAGRLEDERVSRYVVLDGAALAVVHARSPSGVTPAMASMAREHARVRAELESLGADVIADYRVLANALQIVAPRSVLASLGRIEGVARVDPVTRVAPVRRDATPRIGAPIAWEAPGGFTGEGVTIAVIDTGIDYTHADFGGPGAPSAYSSNDRTTVEPGTFPTERVIGGFDFAGDDYDASAGTGLPAPDADPLDCGGHGTHVSGIAAGGGVTIGGQPYAGPYDRSVEGQTMRLTPGVAPRASLYAFKVFGCNGATDVLAAALERAADPNGDGEFSDRVDVINGSLGSEYGLDSPTEAEVVRNLTALGTLFVAAAGNDGTFGRPFYSLGSPASYTEVLSVAAALNDRSEFLAFQVDAPAEAAGPVPFAEGNFAPPIATAATISSRVLASDPILGCEPYANAADVAGKIVLVDRGDCPFVDKFRRASEAGAAAIIIVDNEFSDVPFAMNGDMFVDLPGVMVRRSDGERLRELIDEGLTISLAASLFPGAVGPDYVTDFSSRGPTAVRGLLKPEITAPGARIRSADVGSGSGVAIQQGTSQASPFVAGAAALAVQAHPELDPIGIKAVLMNTAAPVVGLTGDSFPTTIAGAGRLDIARAVLAHVTAMAESPPGAVGVSFGGIVTAEPVIERRRIFVENHGPSAVRFESSAAPSVALAGVNARVEPQSFEVAAHAHVVVTLELSIDPWALPLAATDGFTATRVQGEPRHFNVEATGTVQLVADDPTQSIVVPYYAVVRPASREHAGTPRVCANDGDRVTIPIEGTSAHPERVVTAFQLVAEPALTHDTHSIRAVGVATDYAAVGSVSGATLYIALAATDEWNTPALGRFGRTRVFVDLDGDGSPERLLSASAVQSIMGFRLFSDALTAQVTDLGTEPAYEGGLPLNIVPRSEADTAPFQNQVLVLPVRLSSLGATDANPIVHLAARADLDLVGVPNRADYVAVDATALSIDTTSFGDSGLPIFKGETPVTIAATDRASSRVLILHHSGEPNARFDIVDLASTLIDSSELAIAGESPASVVEGGRFTSILSVDNTGSGAAPDVRLSAAIAGASIVLVETDRGSCAPGQSVSCAFGDLAPGDVARVSVTLAAGENGDVAIDARADTAAACASSGATTELVTKVADLGAPESVGPRGGCGCRAQSARGGPPILLIFAAALARRRARRHDGRIIPPRP